MPTLVVAINARAASVGASRAADAFNKVKRKAGEASASLSKMQARTTGVGSAMKLLRGPLAGLITGFTALLIIRRVTSLFVDFEKTMATVRAVTGANEQQFVRLNNIVREIGATTEFTAAQAGKGLLALAKSGFTVNEAIEAVGQTVDFATAGLISIDEAADIASISLRQFSLDASELNRVTDSLILGANRSSTDVRGMAEALKFAGVSAGLLGISVETTSTALAVMAKRGLRGSIAGTSLNRAFVNLTRGTPKIRRALAGVGLTINDVSLETNTFVESMANLNKAFANVSPAKKFALAQEIFQIRGARAGAIISQNIDLFKELEEEMNRASGTTKKIADIIRDTLFGSLKNLISALQEGILQLGDAGFAGGLRAVVDQTTDVIRVMIGMEKAVKGNIVVAKVLAAAVQTITIALAAFVAIKIVGLLGAMIVGLGGATGAMLIFTTAVLANPFTAVIATIAIVVAAFVSFNTIVTSTAEIMKDLEVGSDKAAASFTTFLKLEKERRKAIQKGEDVPLIEQFELLKKQEKALKKSTGELIKNNQATDKALKLAKEQLATFKELSKGAVTSSDAVDKLTKKSEEIQKKFFLLRVATIKVAEALKNIGFKDFTGDTFESIVAQTAFIEVIKLEGELIGKTAREIQLIIGLRKAEAFIIKNNIKDREKFLKQVKDEIKLNQERSAAVNITGFIKGLEEEVKFLRLGIKEREVAIAIRNAELIAKAGGIKLTKTEIEQITELIQLRGELKKVGGTTPFFDEDVFASAIDNMLNFTDQSIVMSETYMLSLQEMKDSLLSFGEVAHEVMPSVEDLFTTHANSIINLASQSIEARQLDISSLISWAAQIISQNLLLLAKMQFAEAAKIEAVAASEAARVGLVAAASSAKLTLLAAAATTEGLAALSNPVTALLAPGFFAQAAILTGGAAAALVQGAIQAAGILTVGAAGAAAATARGVAFGATGIAVGVGGQLLRDQDRESERFAGLRGGTSSQPAIDEKQVDEGPQQITINNEFNIGTLVGRDTPAMDELLKDMGKRITDGVRLGQRIRT